ncbi:peptidase family C50 [Ancylostoma duodenale]|uniref:separase n=1 Tax=Ancylostoma duodenale TaxID=51022 RepID=A0A0C2GIN7_9BILA|nr:peptidase family C50 [Ancylostoma duodenale]
MDIMRTIYSVGTSVSRAMESSYSHYFQSETLSSKTSFGCTKKKPPEMLEFVDNIDLPMSAKTPPRCKSPGRITSKFIDSFHELTLSDNYNAAFEYWMSSFLYESMSNESIQCLEKQFQTLRARVAVEQRAVLGKKVKPRPPSIMCETFAMCAVRWLRSLEDSGWDHDNSSVKALREQIIASTLKQYEKKRAVATINNFQSTVAQYLFSPICRTASTSDGDDSEEQKKIEEAAIAEANAEYASYSPWEAAMMWSESTLLTTRQHSRLLLGKMSGFTFSHSNLFKKMVEKLPTDFTIVQLAMSHDGSLHLIKMHKDREPIIMPLAPKTKVESVKSMMDKIIEDNTRTSSLGKVTKDAKAFWAARRSVDGDLKNLIPRVQDILLGAAAPLVLPSLCLNRKGLMMAKCLVSASQSSDGSTLSLSYAKVPVAVNASNAFYILDPDNNLGDTQRRITDYVSKFGWNGVVGKVPDPDVVKEALRARDVFFYMGHGSGSRYFSRRVISENVINAVSVLMGCGSVKLTPYGWGMDGKSAVYDYTVAQCPSVVGCLWTVTDGEIDRYFMALVDLCFSSDGNRTLTGTDGGDSRLRVLVEAMHRARARCKLPYLTGASSPSRDEAYLLVVAEIQLAWVKPGVCTGTSCNNAGLRIGCKEGPVKQSVKFETGLGALSENKRSEGPPCHS